MQPWAIALIVVGAVLVLVVAIVAWVIAVYNKLVRLRNVAEEGYSTMDVYMKKRYDLIPNLVETVKGYATHEKETLTKVMEARYSCMSANDPEDRAKKGKAHFLQAGTYRFQKIHGFLLKPSGRSYRVIFP